MPGTPAIRVALVEDDSGIRDSLARLIAGAAGFVRHGSFGTAEEALAMLAADPAEVLLMDINLPRMSGIECVRRLKSLVPAMQVIMLTVYDDEDLLFQSLMAGASGYLLKRTPPDKLLEAIADVHRGSSPMSGQIARMVVQHFNRLGRRTSWPAPPAALTEREAQILELLAQGHRYKEIAGQLNISFDTVRSHLRNIYDKLHVHSRTEAVVKYLGRS